MTFLWVIGKSDKFIRYEELCICDIFGVIMFGCSLMQPLSTRG